MFATVAMGIVGWWLYSLRLKPHVQVVRPLGDEKLVSAIYSAALLANEQAGVLQFELGSEGLFVSFADQVQGWPAESLEGRLRRGRRMRLSDLIFDFLADGSNFPWQRAMKIAEHTAVLRGISGDRVATDIIDTADVEALLQNCREGRPEIWGALNNEITRGLERRKVPPTMKAVGPRQIPSYDYNEQPVSELDRPESRQGEEASEGERKAIVVGPWGNMAVSVILAAGTVLVLLFWHPGNVWWATAAAGISAIFSIATGIVVRRAKRRLMTRRQKAGLVERPEVQLPGPIDPLKELTWFEAVTGVTSWVLLVALLAALTFWLLLLVLLLAWLQVAQVSAQLNKWEKRTAEELVELRLREASAQPEERPNLDVRVERPADLRSDTRLPRIPEPVPPHELPPVSPEIKEKLSRWSDRQDRLFGLYLIGAAVLIGGYALLVAACVVGGYRSHPNDVEAQGIMAVVIPAFLCVAGGFLFRIASLRLLIGFWRVVILLEATFLFLPISSLHRYYAAGALGLIVLHWIWMDWAASKLMRKLPVPEPRRLLMLRVFGSPEFDDLVELINPWMRVGMIEHLEGFDTVGMNPEVQTAMESGEIGRAIAMDMEQVRAHLAMSTAAPDKELLFRRQAFQCSMNTWKEAIQAMMDRADVVVMDLSGFSEKNQGSAWEFGQLLNRVPLNRVTVLVNESTDINCVRRVLDTKTREMSANSPNASAYEAKWQLIRIGGLAARKKDESYFDWKRRLDDRLEPMQLTQWLLSIAGEPKDRETAELARNSPIVRRWGRPARLGWAIALAVSAALTIYVAAFPQ